METIKKLFNKYKQFILFCFVGGMNSLISYGVYALLVVLGMYYTAANLLGDIAGGVNSYLWNSRWVFRNAERRTSRSLPRFVVTFVLFCVLSYLLMWLLVDFFGIPKLLAKIVALPITTLVNFFMNKLWAFKKRG